MEVINLLKDTGIDIFTISLTITRFLIKPFFELLIEALFFLNLYTATKTNRFEISPSAIPIVARAQAYSSPTFTKYPAIAITKAVFTICSTTCEQAVGTTSCIP